MKVLIKLFNDVLLDFSFVSTLFKFVHVRINTLSDTMVRLLMYNIALWGTIIIATGFRSKNVCNYNTNKL